MNPESFIICSGLLMIMLLEGPSSRPICEICFLWCSVKGVLKSYGRLFAAVQITQ